jgi:Ca2+/Na+ antiporter
MKEDQDYIRDIAQIRSIMERSSRFLSLAGWAGIMAGVYALAGAYIAYTVFDFNPDKLVYSTIQTRDLVAGLPKVVFLAITVLILAIGTAILLSYKKAAKRGEKLWNALTKRLLINMAVPLIAGGLLILILIANGLIGLMAPITLLFYGLALYSASQFTYEVLRSLGLIQIGLGLLSAYFVEYGLVCWALGFGVAHIVYGIYMHYRYER